MQNKEKEMFFFNQIKKINIGHDGKGSEQQWFLKTIQIEKKHEQYQYDQIGIFINEKSFSLDSKPIDG